MALASELVKVCGIKIVSLIKGVRAAGSGVLYLTSNRCSYNYVLTAKHIFQEDSQTPFDINVINSVSLFYNDNGQFSQLEYIPKKAVKNKIISFVQDFAIVIVKKSDGIPFRQILVADDLEDSDKKFIFWSIFKANENELHKFSLNRSDPENRRYQLCDQVLPEFLSGMSGAGVFLEDHHKLYGVISRYPNEAFQNATIDCARISFLDINAKLAALNKEVLDTQLSKSKREINNEVIDIHQLYINNACLDLEEARKRLVVDLTDDWYQDPLRYKDLLTQEYLFEEFSKYFSQLNHFEASKAENFYVPKKKFTLRLAMVSPFIDRIIYMACVGVLADRLDEAMIPNVFSARYDKYTPNHLILNGVEQWKKLRYCLGEHATKKDSEEYTYGCIIEVDLLNFYDNINKDLLHEKILRICKTDNEKNAAVLLRDILTHMSAKAVGLPQNSDASSLLASFYLNQVDIFMLHHVNSYFRFMDDVRIFCRDKYEARELLQTFEFELRRCYLSVNSQKTEIFTLVEQKDETSAAKQHSRFDFNNIFDLPINRIARLRKSKNHELLNEAFHECIALLKEKMVEAEDPNEDAAKKINYAFNTLTYLGANGIALTDKSTGFKEILLKAVIELKDKPWFTSEVCRVLNLIPIEDLPNYIPAMIELVLNSKYNLYTFQVYQIWLLLAKRKWNDLYLTQYAVTQIERNDDTNQPVIAAMIIYMCSIDEGYRRVIVRKFGENFTRGYFECRLALIAVRSFGPEFFQNGTIHSKLQHAHQFTNHFSDKDLVFVLGFDEEEKDDDQEDFIEEHLFSL